VRRVAFVGRLCEPKGVSDLLQALAAAPLARERVQVTLAGNGDIEGYQRLARDLGIEGFVRFTGWCDQEAVQALLRESDLLVLPSHDEVLPLVVLEALAQGLAVICTPVGELPGVLTDGENASFVPAGDVQALGRAIASLLGDDAWRERLGRNGRALYEQRFSMDRFFERVARVHRRHFGVAAQGEAPRREESA
jgi:glycosyltransferase involved in cell wall biosynthesis